MARREARGVAFAALAAVAFGATAPGVERFGRGVGPFATATLLYAGAVLCAAAPERGGRPVGRADAPRVVVVGLLGAALAPAALAWGLQRTGATSGALVLNLEAVFAVALARALYRERLGARLGAAVALIAAAGVLVPLRGGAADMRAGAGLAIVALSTLAWATDSTLSRPLAERRASSVVLWKSLVGVAASASIALAAREAWPDARGAAGLLACGVLGYGLSLRLYVLAQRAIGAARTASVFGFAPLCGAAMAFALGDRRGALVVGASGALACAGVALLATERRAAGAA